jgi:hypothetical protein
VLERLDDYIAVMMTPDARGYEIELRKVDPWYTRECPSFQESAIPSNLAGAVARHQMEVSKYERGLDKAVSLKKQMLSSLLKLYRTEADKCESPIEIFYTVHKVVQSWKTVIRKTIKQEYYNLRFRKLTLSADAFCEPMLSMY